MPRISSAAPDLFAGYAAELGALWYDDVNLLWKKCTSTSPLTFSSIEGGGGGGAPTDAQYVCLASNGTLTNERVLTAGTNISIVDGGPGAAVTISAMGGSGNTYFPSGWM
jgi:hypothetical protein